MQQFRKELLKTVNRRRRVLLIKLTKIPTKIHCKVSALSLSLFRDCQEGIRIVMRFKYGSENVNRSVYGSRSEHDCTAPLSV